jgi:hypothetical protein
MGGSLQVDAATWMGLSLRQFHGLADGDFAARDKENVNSCGIWSDPLNGCMPVQAASAVLLQARSIVVLEVPRAYVFRPCGVRS